LEEKYHESTTGSTSRQFKRCGQCKILPIPKANSQWRFGDRAFSVAAPHALNRLPAELKPMRSSTTTFKRHLISKDIPVQLSTLLPVSHWL